MKISKKSLLSFIILATVSIFLLNTSYVFAAVEFDPGGRIRDTLDVPDTSAEHVIIRIIQWALGLLGLIAVVFVIFGGIMWMTSAGNEEKITKAKKIITSALIGLIVVTLSWAIITFIIRTTANVTS